MKKTTINVFERCIVCILLAGLLLLSSICDCFSSLTSSALFPSRTVYFGVNMGGGSTEWKYLVDTTDPNANTDTSTPTSVAEGGPSWGVVLGFDVAKNFAIELQYMQFANALIYFSPDAAYNDQNGNSILSIASKTDAYSLSGKFFVPIGFRPTHLRAFAAIGAGLVERRDPLVNYSQAIPYTGAVTTISCVTPYVASGLDYNFTRHWILESGFQYYTGFGASQLLPVASFIPFAWDAYGRLAYQL